MNRPLVAGVVCAGLGLTGYAVGVLIPYPGRALSLTLLMTGIALIAMRRLDEDRAAGEGR